MLEHISVKENKQKKIKKNKRKVHISLSVIQAKNKAVELYLLVSTLRATDGGLASKLFVPCLTS